jgi:hypothetical protein
MEVRMSLFSAKKKLIFEGRPEEETRDQLDWLVDNQKSLEASDINNQGADSQLTYLFQAGWSAEQIKMSLDLIAP